MICALLIFQDPELPRPLGSISPWIDMVTKPRKEVFADLAGQQHRRFLKTHTPAPRPAARSTRHVPVRRPGPAGCRHVDGSPRRQPQHRAAPAGCGRYAAAADGVVLRATATLAAGPPGRPRPVLAVGRGRQRSHRHPSSLRSTLRRLESFWNAPDNLDVVRLHYDDLLADLEGQIRGLADRLDITVPEQRWPTLVEAAGLDAMRRRTALTAPGDDAEPVARPGPVLPQGHERPMARPVEPR